MILLHRLVSVLRWILNRRRAERALDDELQSFVELSAAEKMREGLAPAEARRLAILELGGVEQVKERVRSYRHGGWLDEIGRDIRYALRTCRRSPGFTAVAVLTLAAGIGANTAIFSLIDALMLRRLPVPHARELVQLSLRAPGSTGPGGPSFSYAIVRAIAERREIFAGVAGFSGTSFEVGRPGSVTRVPGAFVTGGYYDTLGLHPAAGRLLTREDDESGAPLVAVISDGYWDRQFARSPEAVGEILHVGALPVTIVGVSPPGFVGANVGAVADLTMAVATLPQVGPTAAPLLGPGNFWLRVLARPRAGTSTSQAMSQLNAAWPQVAESVIASHWPARRRQEMADSTFVLSSGGTGWTYLRDIYRKPLFVLMAVVGLVLLIACANVASLLLARASARQREIAVRLALGAGRARIVRQLLIESLVLSSAGAAFGFFLALVVGRALVDMISTGPVQVAFDLAPNLHVLGFTSVITIATAVLFGIAPAFQSTAVGPSAALKEDTRSSLSRPRLLPFLVSAQVALSLVLLAGAGLFVRTVRNLQTLDPGFNAEGVLLVDFDRRPLTDPKQLLETVQQLPGVAYASFSTHTPLSGAVWSEPAVPAEQLIPERDNAHFVGAGPRFFTIMQIQMLSGREFTARDTKESPAVAVINEAFSRQHFPGINPVGRRLAATVRGQRTELEVVGVANNTHTAGLRETPPATVYVSYDQLSGSGPTTLVVRATGGIGRVASAIEHTVRSSLPDAPLEVQPLTAQIGATIVQERMVATLAAGFGVLALTLASVGIYGLLAYGVAQRTREIGIRVALGAQGRRVVALVVARAMRLVAIGIALGLPAAWAASRSVESMLFGLTPTDPVAIGAAVVLLSATALLAAYLPARRASRVDPMIALRHN